MNVPGNSNVTIRMPARPQGAKWIDAPRVVDRLNYRNDGSGWRPDGFLHVFVISDQGGTPRQLTDGNYQDGAAKWLPDSRTILFSGVRKEDAEYLRGGSEIYSVSLDGGTIRALTDREGPDTNPTVSRDGKLIAYMGFDQNDNTYNVTKLYLMNADGSSKRVLAADFDRSPAGLFWAEDGSGIYFTTEDRGSDNLWFESARGGAPRQVTTGTQILGVSTVSRNGVAVGVRTTPNEPGNVVSVDLKTPKNIRQLTWGNASLLEGRKLGEV